ncbi:unnamed protein product [Closterium sp. Naga37s-1]|nr:unnamed protein product [Closterium sp. Naga37s-1]
MASDSVHRDTGMIELDLPLPDVITATDAAGTSAISTLVAGPGSVKPVSAAEEAAAAAAGMFLANTPGVVTACGVHVCACSDYKEAIYDLANASWRQLGDVCVMNNNPRNSGNSIPARSHTLLEKRADDPELLLSAETAEQVNQQHPPQQQEEPAQEEFSFFQFPVVPQRTMSLPLVDRPRLGEASPLGNDGWAVTGVAGAVPDWRDMSAAEEVRCAAMREQGYCLFARGGGVCSPGGLGGATSGAEPGGGAEDCGGGHAILELKLAQTGEGIAECELLQWFVEEGEEVRAFQRVCQVQSDKATVDITSRFHGRILRTHFMPGDVVKVGETLADILPPGAGEPVATSAPPPHDTSSEPQSSSASSTSSSSTTSQSHSDQSHEVLAVPAVRHLARTHGINLADVEGTGRDGRVTKEDVLAYVQSRQGVEEEMRMEEHVLEGPEPAMAEPGGLGAAAAGGGGGGAGGKGGVLVGGGVEAGAGEAVGRMGVAAAAVGVQGEGVGAGACARARVEDSNDILLPMRGYRRAMARAMAAALAVPHFTFMDEVAMDAALSLRSQLNSASSSAAASAAAAAAASAGGGGSAAKPAAADKAGGAAAVRLTHLPILVKALSVALHDYPTLNSTLDDASMNHLRCKRAHNIGIAMATPSGLVVPNVKNCQSKSIPQIAEDIARLRRLALLNQLPNEDVTGGTISISNIGSIGGTYATPLVHLPEVAIVALGRVHTVPRFDSCGNVVPVAFMNVSWSADHRVIDGATLAAFSSHWKSFIECPTNLLLHLM